jgi:ABC-type hemin transport system substrate-binding protein
MFAIEFVAVRDRHEPEVVEKMTSNVTQLVDVDKTAKSLLEKVRQKRHATPPDGYRIRAHDGRIALRWW